MSANTRGVFIWLADCLISGNQKHGFSGLIEQEDPLLFVHGDDGIHGGLHDAIQPQAADEQLPGGSQFPIQCPC